MLSRARSEEVIQPVKKAAVGTDDQEGLVPRIVNAYMRSLRKQRVQFLIFIEIYVLVFLVGLGIVLWHSRFQHMWAERKRRREAMRGLSPTPYPVSDSDNNRRDMAEKSHLSISAPLSNYGNVQSGAGNGNGQADDDMPVQPTLGSLLAEQTKSWDSFLDMPRDDGVKEAPSVRVAKLFGRKGGMATTSKPHTPPPLRLGHAKGRLHSVSESSIRSVKSKLSAEEIKPHPGNARVDADSEMRDTGDEPSSFVSRARSLFSGAVSWWFNLPDSPSTSGKNISKSTTARSSPVRFRPSSDESFATRDQSSEDEHERSRHLSVSQSSTFDTSRAEAMPKDWGREPLWSLIEPVVPQSFAPVPETRRENKRQLRFTATPTDQVEARKRRQEAEMPPIPLTPSRSLPQATPPSRSILSAPPPPPPPPSPPPPATHGHTRAQGPHFTAEQLYDAARKRRSYQYQAFEAGASGAPTRPLSLRSSLTRPPSWAKPHSGSRRPFSLDTATATGKVTGKPDRPRSQFPHRHPHRLSAITIGTTRAQTRTRTSMRTASAVRKHPSTLARSSGLQHIAESPSSCSWYEEAQRDEPGLAFGERVGTCLAHGQETGAGAGAQVRLDHVSPGANASPCPCLTPVIVRQGHAF